MKHLENKVVLVTGAARGLGWGIARAMGKNGARVCISDINDEELGRAENDLKNDGSDVFSVHLDVSELKKFEETVNLITARWGRLDVVVHNAIYMPLIRFEDTSPELWWRQIDVGLGGLFNACKASWDIMKKQGGGHIIGIASGSSRKGFKEEVTYCAIKHGQEGFVKALSLESAMDHIAINTVGPGKIIKPTRITWSELDALSEEDKKDWTDPVKLGEGLVWLASQSPDRFSGLRFDAGVIADTISAEGFDFEFSPEKVTLLPDEFRQTREWYANYTD